jgi:hypothetical protein
MGVSQTRSDFGSEEDDDMVHVNRQGTCLSEYKKSSSHPCQKLVTKTKFKNVNSSDIYHNVIIEQDNALHRMLFRQESAHGLGIHSEGEQEDFSDGEDGHHSTHLQAPSHKHHHHDSEKTRSVSQDRDITKSTSGISFGMARDRKTVAEKLQTAFGYPELEDFLGGM